MRLLAPMALVLWATVIAQCGRLHREQPVTPGGAPGLQREVTPGETPRVWLNGIRHAGMPVTPGGAPGLQGRIA